MRCAPAGLLRINVLSALGCHLWLEAQTPQYSHRIISCIYPSVLFNCKGGVCLGQASSQSKDWLIENGACTATGSLELPIHLATTSFWLLHFWIILRFYLDFSSCTINTFNKYKTKTHKLNSKKKKKRKKTLSDLLKS